MYGEERKQGWRWCDDFLGKVELKGGRECEVTEESKGVMEEVDS